jgi:hypothetical protein
VRQILQVLQDNGLVIHGEKYVWGVPELDCLDHWIAMAGVLQLHFHVAAIQEFPHPSTVKELHSFLGMVNFIRRFLPGLVCTLCPLTSELHGSRKGSEHVAWQPWTRHLLLPSRPCWRPPTFPIL